MGRAPCCDKNGLKKGPWTPEEDLKLIGFIQTHGAGNWRTLPKNAGLQRCGKSCRLRWTNYLRPDIKRGRFSFEEEEAIIQLHSVLGNKWSAIAARLPGRTDNEIKNYWNTNIRKRLLKMGIDPVTHAPRLDLLDITSILSSALCNQHSLINLSSMLGNQALLNPELLNLASCLLALQQKENMAGFSSENLQESQANGTVDLQSQLQELLSKSQIRTQTGQHSFLSDMITSSQVMQTMSPTSQAMIDYCRPTALDNSIASNVADLQVNQTNGFYCGTSQDVSCLVDQNSNLQVVGHNQNQNFGFDSALSTPLSGTTPLDSASTYINCGGNEDDSYCSNLLTFEIPESLDISDFM